MNTQESRSIIAYPSQEMTAPLDGRNRILYEIVESALAQARESTPAFVDLDGLVREGKRILRGEGMTPDDVRAFGLFLQAASAGHGAAQFLVSECYRCGNGTEMDDAASVEWVKKSAESGNPDAEYWLGERYLMALGVKEDGTESDKWFQRAAKHGNADAQVWMGELCVASGVGYEAEQWFREAAAQGNAEAQYQLGLFFSGAYQYGECFQTAVTEAACCFLLGERVSFDVVNVETREIVIPANRKITKAKLRMVTTLFLDGKLAASPITERFQQATSKLKEQAAAWFRMAAEQGWTEAQERLAHCYKVGDGLEVDLSRAYAWFSLSADEYRDLAAKIRSEGGFVLTSDKQAEDALNEVNRLASEMSPSEIEIGNRLYQEFKSNYSAKW